MVHAQNYKTILPGKSCQENIYVANCDELEQDVMFYICLMYITTSVATCMCISGTHDIVHIRSYIASVKRETFYKSQMIYQT